MIPARPSVHCPHVGLSGKFLENPPLNSDSYRSSELTLNSWFCLFTYEGGGMCAENNYVSRVLSPPFTAPLVGGV